MLWTRWGLQAPQRQHGPTSLTTALTALSLKHHDELVEEVSLRDSVPSMFDTSLLLEQETLRAAVPGLHSTSIQGRTYHRHEARGLMKWP